MLQLWLLLHATSLAPTRIHVSSRAPIPIRITSPITPIPISTRIHIPTTTPSLTLNNTLTSAPLPLAPARPRRGIPRRQSLLAGSCHQLRRHREPTSIKGLLHAAL